MKAFSLVEGSCAILGEGKTLQRGMGEMFLEGNFLGDVIKSWIFFSCGLKEGHCISFIRKMTNLNREEVGWRSLGI